MIFYDSVSQSIESQLNRQGKTLGKYEKKFEEEKNMILCYSRMNALSEDDKNRAIWRLNRKVMKRARDIK